MSFERFIGDKGESQEKDKRPGDKNISAPKIKDEIRREDSPKEELKDVDVPKMHLAWVGLVPRFMFLGMNENNKKSKDKKMSNGPNVFPEGINTL